MQCKFCKTSNAPYRCEAFVGANRYVCDECYVDNYGPDTMKYSSDSVQRDCWTAPPLTRIQMKKLLYLQERGGTVVGATLRIQCKSGLCSLDEFGRADWTETKQSNTGI